MIIDYSLQNSSYSVFCANGTFGQKHLELAFTNEIPFEIMGLVERIVHFIVGFLECIPLVGHLIAGGDFLLNRRASYIQLLDEDPYQRGLRQGQSYKQEIQLLYALVKQKIGQRAPIQPAAIDQLQRRLSVEIIQEMTGIAEGAEVDLRDVFLVHAYVDLFAGMFGCTAMASMQRDGRANKVAASSSNAPERVEQILNAPLDLEIESHHAALQNVEVAETIHTVLFDLTRRRVHAAFAWNFATQKSLSTHEVFERDESALDERQIKLVRNLDWPWKFIAPYTTIVESSAGARGKKFVNVTFPGFIGVLTAMNSDRVGVACCQSGVSKQENGLPNTLLFREVITKASTTAEAIEILNRNHPASSMKLVIAGADALAVAELDPGRSPRGIAELTRREIF